MQPPSAATAQNPSPSSSASFGPSQRTPMQSNPHRPSSTDYSPAASSFAASAADTAAAMSSSLRHTSDVLQAADRQVYGSLVIIIIIIVMGFSSPNLLLFVCR